MPDIASSDTSFRVPSHSVLVLALVAVVAAFALGEFAECFSTVPAERVDLATLILFGGIFLSGLVYFRYRVSQGLSAIARSDLPSSPPMMTASEDDHRAYLERLPTMRFSDGMHGIPELDDHSSVLLPEGVSPLGAVVLFCRALKSFRPGWGIVRRTRMFETKDRVTLMVFRPRADFPREWVGLELTFFVRSGAPSGGPDHRARHEVTLNVRGFPVRPAPHRVFTAFIGAWIAAAVSQTARSTVPDHDACRRTGIMIKDAVNVALVGLRIQDAQAAIPAL